MKKFIATTLLALAGSIASLSFSVQAVRVNNLLFPEELVAQSDAIVVGRISSLHVRPRRKYGQCCSPTAAVRVSIDRVLAGAVKERAIEFAELAPCEIARNQSHVRWRYSWLQDEHTVSIFEFEHKHLQQQRLWFLKKGKHWDDEKKRGTSFTTWCPVTVAAIKWEPFYAALVSRNPEAGVNALRNTHKELDKWLSGYLERLRAKRAGNRPWRIKIESIEDGIAY